VDHKGLRRAKRCGSKKAAQLVADKLDAALRLGHMDVLAADRHAPPRPVLTFKEYAEKWLESVGSIRLRPSTVEQYRVRLGLRLLPTLGPMPLASITREVVRTLLGEMVAQGNRRSKGRPASRGTIQAALRTLSAILSTAEEDGLIPTNPTRRMGKQLVAPTGTVGTHEIEVFSRDELSHLLGLAERESPEYYPFLLCLARTGMRLGEAIGLEWRDVEWRARYIIVRRSRRRNRVSEPKNGKARRVDMSQQLADVLRGFKTLQEAEAVVAGSALPGRVFSNRAGGPIQEDDFRNNVWAPLLRQAQLRYRKPHTMRHTFASLLIEAGEPLTYVQQQLGHHSAAFTLKVYGHLLPRGDRRAVDALDDAPGTRAAEKGATIRNPPATEHASSSQFSSFSR
jgi:integrase